MEHDFAVVTDHREIDVAALLCDCEQRVASHERASADRADLALRILAEADRRDYEANARDAAANRRDMNASLSDLLKGESVDIDVLEARRAAALDRTEARADRAAAKADRALLANGWGLR